MTDKERFVRAVNSFLDYRDALEKRCKMLEQAFGSDTSIFDFHGLEELFTAVCDMSVYIFPNLKEETIKDNLEWFVYEAQGMKDPVVSAEDGGKEWIVSSPEVLYDMLAYFNNEEPKDRNMDSFFDTMERNLKG